MFQNAVREGAGQRQLGPGKGCVDAVGPVKLTPQNTIYDATGSSKHLRISLNLSLSLPL